MKAQLKLYPIFAIIFLNYEFSCLRVLSAPDIISAQLPTKVSTSRGVSIYREYSVALSPIILPTDIIKGTPIAMTGESRELPSRQGCALSTPLPGHIPALVS